MEKIVNISRKDYSKKLGDVLWVHHNIFKTPTFTSSYCLVFRNACHLPGELKYKAFWVIKILNPSMQAVGEKRLLQLNEMDEFYKDTYEHARIYKEHSKN